MGCINSRQKNIVKGKPSESSQTNLNYNSKLHHLSKINIKQNSVISSERDGKRNSTQMISFTKFTSKSINNFATQRLFKESNLLPENEILNKIEEEPDEKDILLVKNSLCNHFLFKDKTDTLIKQLIDKLIFIQIKAEVILYTEGDSESFFYIVKEGVLMCSKSGVDVNKHLKRGDTFGDLALIQTNMRSETVTCVEDAELFSLDGSVFRDLIKKINKKNLNERLFFLSLLPIFNGLSGIQLHNIALAMLECEFQKGHMIIDEGDVGESLFIIKEGVVSCRKRDVEIRKLTFKDHFGEAAILFGLRRSLSVISLNKTVCFQISHSFMIENFGENYKNVLLKSIVREAFSKSKYLNLLVEDNYFPKIFYAFNLIFYKNGETVISKTNTSIKKLIIVIQGNIVENSEEKKIVATRGQLYGESLIKYSAKTIINDIVSDSDCIAMEANWNKIISIVNLDIESNKILSFISQVAHMKNIEIFRHSSLHTIVEICKFMKKEKFNSGQIIFDEGKKGDKLYLIIRGKVEVYKNSKLVRKLEEGNCFGEVSLLVDEPRSASVYAETKVVTYTLSKENFISFIDNNMLDFLLRKISLQDICNTNLTDLFYVESLGQGKFGTVSLVHNGKNQYAIKSVHKRVAEKQKILTKYFTGEKNILLSLDHPFIMKLVKTLKTEDFIFYLMEYIPGIVLSTHIENRTENNLRNKFQSQFYSAILLLIVDYLNKKSVVHRDIKPENIIIDDKGYIKLIDFGTAIKIKDFTSTITGTPHYIAPEILLGKGYSYSCDYWSIGIVAYELYYGEYPFGNIAADPMDVYKEVLRKELEFPKSFGDFSVVNFLNFILRKKVHERICNLKQLKYTEFFEDFKWNELIDFSLAPPFTPKKSSMNPFNSKIKFLDYLHKKKEWFRKDSIQPCQEDEVSYYNLKWTEEF